MQSFKLLLITFFSVSSLFATSQVKTESVQVWGNCGMCQSRIEKAAITGGAQSANWNADTDLLTVSYGANTSLSAIEAKVASAGHDTKNKTAVKDAYNKLHGCCKYQRKHDSSAAGACCSTGVSCCLDSGACCTKAGAAVKASAMASCADNACGKAGQECCKKTGVDKTCGVTDTCCPSAEGSCEKSSTDTSDVKGCCVAGAGCCAGGQACCARVRAAA